MTLGAIKSAAADRDSVFSQALRAQAQCLELTTVMPVGDWDYGQGVRRAKADQFFWELSSQDYSPLGLHHPVTLVVVNQPETNDLAPQNFSADLIKTYPELAKWSWTLLPLGHAWLQQNWSKTGAWDGSFGPHLFETDATLKSSAGWLGFENLANMLTWAVQLSPQVIWVATPQGTLPSEGLSAPAERALLKVFLSADVHASNGRIQELRQVLSQKFPQAKMKGLNLKFGSIDASSLKKMGLSCDHLVDGSGLCFPLSFLSEDLMGVEKLLSVKG